MATNKNQHFVPRCYLRPFTVDSGNAAIHVFNLDRKRLIAHAPVKNQCSRNYFYGQNENLERGIQMMESAYAIALKSSVEAQHSLTSTNESVFRTFWLLQHLRTEAAAIRAVEMSESTRELAELPPGEFTLNIKEAVQMAMRAFTESAHLINDLKFCLLRNRTRLPFITSDNPAVLTNRWYLGSSRTSGRSFGLNSAGALIFLPLSPKLFFLGYDGDVYNVTHQNGVAEIKSERDVLALNEHQFLQCTANVYVHDAAFEEMLRTHYAKISSARPKARHAVHYAQFDCTEGSYSRYVVVPRDERDKTKEAIMHAEVIHPRPTCWPSQVRHRASGSVYTNGSGVGYVRYASTHSPSKPSFWRERS